MLMYLARLARAAGPLRQRPVQWIRAQGRSVVSPVLGAATVCQGIAG
jgi:hypothetical protein